MRISLKRMILSMFGFSFLPFSVVFAQTNSSWTFAVSGDSRNCGDIIMPAIATRVRKDSASFYWHLGDFRAFYDFDQDMLASKHGKLGVVEYETRAWQDFIDQQLVPFGDLPVFLALGNHEVISKSRPDALIQFADWFDSATIRSQRLSDDPSDHKLRGYYHWHEHNLDFITMDNASPEQFDHDQLLWFEKILKRDEEDPRIRTVIVGMHDALPDSLSAGHSMNESSSGTESGRRVYKGLVEFKKRSGKEVQVLASHSHFLMSDVYKTSCHRADDVLPGWIVGTAGATRYRLPSEHAGADIAQTDVYGYLLGTVTSEGHVSFSFRQITMSDVSEETRARYGADVVDKCFEENKNDYIPEGPNCEIR
jgi:hypothetical protein